MNKLASKQSQNKKTMAGCDKSNQSFIVWHKKHGKRTNFIPQLTNIPHQALDSLLVERLGVGGGGSDVSVTGSLVGASGELEAGGSREVGVAGAGVGSGVVPLEVEFIELGEHWSCLGVSGTDHASLQMCLIYTIALYDQQQNGCALVRRRGGSHLRSQMRDETARLDRHAS